MADLAEAADAAAELVRLGKERWDTERPLRLAGAAVIGRLGDIAAKLPDEVITAMPEIPWREVKGMSRPPSDVRNSSVILTREPPPVGPVPRHPDSRG